MLAVLDQQIRLVLLNHVAVRLEGAESAEVRASGIETELLARLRQLSTLDLNRLAGMRALTIGVAFDPAGLKAGLRAVALMNEANALESYFIRNGASCRMMASFFKMRRKVTLQRRRESGAGRPSGRLKLPDYLVRERIYRKWLTLDGTDPRSRYQRLHDTFQQYSIAVLEAVVCEFEAEK